MLRDRGVRLAIVTGKGAGSAEISLRLLGVGDLFDLVEVGSPTGGIKPISIRRVLERWGLPPSRVAYVGDATYDMQAAKEVGLVALGAAWADTADASALRIMEPAAVFSSVEDFAAWIDSHTGPSE
jgi:pyrophosphatase PpaX